MNEVGFENDATINCEVILNKTSASITARTASEDTGVETSPVVTRMLWIAQTT
jgi:ribosomal protein S5